MVFEETSMAFTSKFRLLVSAAISIGLNSLAQVTPKGGGGGADDPEILVVLPYHFDFSGSRTI